MASNKKKPAKGAKKAIRGKIPTKRSINLILIDENKINPILAALGIIIIVALAAAFSKFMVIDRMAEASAARSRASQLEQQLEEAKALLEDSDELEDKYAHYTMAGMTQSELGLVDRTRILGLVEEILPVDNIMVSVQKFNARFNEMSEEIMNTQADAMDADALRARVLELFKAILPVDGTTRSWSVSGNLLTLDVTGSSLERLNQLAREIEQNPIVDSCSITSANKDRNREADQGVQARFIVYLVQPVEEEAPAEGGAEA